MARAAALLRAGALVAFPTETVYGLGADATDARAVAARVRGQGPAALQPADRALSRRRPGVAGRGARRAGAEALAAAFWPGPLTLVLPRRADSEIALLAAAGLDTLAVRVPLHPWRGRCWPASGARSPPLRPTAPARSARPRRRTCWTDWMAGSRLCSMAGRARSASNSTVLDLSGGTPRLLRPGGLPAEAIEAAIGPLARGPAGATLRGPGQLASHYAPRLPVRLGARAAGADEALLAFGPALPAALAFNLSAEGNLAEAAACLFAGLRWLDAEGQRRGLRGIAAMPVPAHGLGLAINDRLARAAA